MTPERVALLEAIAMTAGQVRLLQREYFRSHGRDTLIASKGAERELDLLLGDLDQPRLFTTLPPTDLITGRGEP